MFIIKIMENLILKHPNAYLFDIIILKHKKRYKCFDPHTRRMLVTMDVTFFETKPYFSHDHPQWENKSVDFIPSELFELDQLFQPPLVQ